MGPDSPEGLKLLKGSQHLRALFVFEGPKQLHCVIGLKKTQDTERSQELLALIWLKGTKLI